MRVVSRVVGRDESPRVESRLLRPIPEVFHGMEAEPSKILGQACRIFNHTNRCTTLCDGNAAPSASRGLVRHREGFEGERGLHRQMKRFPGPSFLPYTLHRGPSRARPALIGSENLDRSGTGGRLRHESRALFGRIAKGRMSKLPSPRHEPVFGQESPQVSGHSLLDSRPPARWRPGIMADCRSRRDTPSGD